MFGSKKNTTAAEPSQLENENKAVPTVWPDGHVATGDLAEVHKSFWQRLWPVMACGAGLFSDGYINNVSKQ